MEIGQELGLGAEDLDGLLEIGSYVYSDPPGMAHCGVEHRTVFRGRFREGALERIRFVDGEMAGIAVFAVPELAELIRAHPETVASGLAASAGFYPGLTGGASS